jgi:hypothetical protein
MQCHPVDSFSDFHFGANMNQKNPYIFSLALLAVSVAGCDSSNGSGVAVNANSNSANANVTSSSSTSSSVATFVGKNGLVRVDSDIIEAKDGVLTVNGIPYGTVSATSVVKYTVQDKEKTLSVDGVIRTPAR